MGISTKSSGKFSFTARGARVGALILFGVVAFVLPLAAQSSPGSGAAASGAAAGAAAPGGVATPSGGATPSGSATPSGGATPSGVAASTGGAASTATSTGSTATAATSGKANLQPVFPSTNTNLIFVEGEDAVVTNFDQQPILSYSTSGLRTLQLSKTVDPPSDTGYYADFEFYVEQPGTYEFWYGGTPPGPLKDNGTGYFSPFLYTIDNDKTSWVYRSTVKVDGSYAPQYYWVDVAPVELTAGQHRIRLQVNQKRAYDGKYFFYLDCFFFARVQNGTADAGSPLPSMFPSSLSGFTPTTPLPAIEDYLIEIRDHPDQLQSYIDLSIVYSIVGDYLNALKYLNRAAVIAPDDAEVMLLKAKNSIWKGDVSSGLDAYRALLKKDPSQLAVWAEAGKVAAWTGNYADSLGFYQDGLKQFPNNLGLIVNMGLTYLWSGDERNATDTFDRARNLASNDFGKLMDLAQTFVIAQVPDRAIEVYRRAMQLFPKNLEGYLSLEHLYVDMGQSDAAQSVIQTITDTFASSSQLDSVLRLAETRANLKSQVLTDYENQLKQQPDNLTLRQVLAQAYFWNGFRDKGTDEYLNILVNYAYRMLRDLNKGNQDLLSLIDESFVLRTAFDNTSRLAGSVRKNLSDTWNAYQSAKAKNGALPDIGAAVASAQALIDTVNGLSSDLQQGESVLADLATQNKSAQATFEKVTGSNHWKWNSGATISEMQEVRSRGVELAGYGLGKVYQYLGRYSSASEIFQSGTSSQGADPAFQYELSQSRLWLGDLNAALTTARTLVSSDATAESDFPSLSKWTSLYDNISQAVPSLLPAPATSAGNSGTATTATGSTPAGGGSNITPDQNLISDLLTQLQTIATAAPKSASQIRNDQDTLFAIFKDSAERGFYQYQEQTFQLRNELGGYYYAARRLNDAILQFQQVLAIDPWDLTAVYQLGEVYETRGAWSLAEANYHKVYTADPTFQNVAHKYNELARDHADQITFQGEAFADNQTLTYEGNADFSTPLNSLLGLHVSFATDANRLYEPPAGESISDYQTYLLSIGVPVDLYFLGLKFEPAAGVTLANSLYRDSTVAAVGATPGIPVYLANFSPWPFGSVSGSFAIGRYLYLNGGYTIAREASTFVPGRPVIYNQSGELNLSTNLGFLGSGIAGRSSLRTYGKVEFLSDGNLLTTALQEVSVGLYGNERPYARASLIGRAEFQNSVFPQTRDYFTPLGVLLLGGGFDGSLTLPVGTDNLGLNIHALAGSYQNQILTPGATTQDLYFEGQVRGDFVRGNADLFVSAVVTGTVNSARIGGSGNPFDYWSLAVNLGYSAKLPSLLVP